MVAKKAPRAAFAQLRPRAFEKLKSLGNEKLLSVQEALRSGKTTTQVAVMIQKDWGDFAEVKQSAVERMLQRYRQKVLIDPAVMLVASVDDAGVKEIVERHKHAYNVLGAMEDLAELQKARVQMFIDQEKLLKVPNNNTRHEIELLQKQLEGIKKTQFDLGVVAFKGPLPAGTVTVHVDPNNGGTTVDVSLGKAVEEALEVIEGVFSEVDDESSTATVSQ